jgi:hypothetical protein
MSSGSRQVTQLAKEVTRGVTPVPFDRVALPFTENSLDAAVNKEDSATILASRLAQSGAITTIDYTGDISAEFRYGIYDELISGAAYNTWTTDSPAVGTDTLTFGGNLAQSFSVLRGYADINNYHVFRGMHVNTFNLTIGVESLATATFGLIGMGRTAASVLPAGTVTTPTLTPVISGISVDDITIDGVTQVGVACITDFEFNWDNTAEVQRCLGGEGAVGAVIATLADGTGSFTMAWSANGAVNYEKQFTGETIAISVSMKDSIGNAYVLTLPKVEITASLPSGGNADILQADFEYRVVEQAPTLTRTDYVPPVGP